MTPKQFAIEAHGSQRYGDYPYEIHLQAVHDVLVEFGFTDERLLAAAWLHDVIEDTAYDFHAIRHEFGLRIAQIVIGVTNEPGDNRKKRAQLTYPKIAADPDCVVVKLADRIANMRTSAKDNPALFRMYRGEYPDFRTALYVGWTSAPEMWRELDLLYRLDLRKP